jgi:hypothetical protein
MNEVSPGNANLRIGELRDANREIGVPGTPAQPNRCFDALDLSKD